MNGSSRPRGTVIVVVDQLVEFFLFRPYVRHPTWMRPACASQPKLPCMALITEQAAASFAPAHPDLPHAGATADFVGLDVISQDQWDGAIPTMNERVEGTTQSAAPASAAHKHATTYPPRSASP